ncbi:MAG TPA: nitroreductase/quinone reductase family protein [Acidimicrobiia bacterium]|nr:nitroreductase/quinone reductase family protein [Acidimicrobiia bacterium]
MDSIIGTALDQGGIADITTIGRTTGRPHRLEIYFHQFDGELFLTGRPGPKRDWEANIEANPEFTLHLKRGVTADIPVRGEPEPDRDVRAAILYRALTESWGSDPERVRGALDRWVEDAPFIRFEPIDQV